MLRAKWQAYCDLPASAPPPTRLRAEDELMTAILNVGKPIVAKYCGGLNGPDDLLHDLGFRLWRWLVGGGRVEDIVALVRRAARNVSYDEFRDTAASAWILRMDDLARSSEGEDRQSADDRGFGVDVYAAAEANSDEQIAAEQDREMVREVIRGLPDGQRTILIEHYVRGKSLDQIIAERHAQTEGEGRHQLNPRGVCIQCRNNVYNTHRNAKMSLAHHVEAIRRGRLN